MQSGSDMPEHITDSREGFSLMGREFQPFCICGFKGAWYPNVFRSKSAEREHVARHTTGKVRAK